MAISENAELEELIRQATVSGAALPADQTPLAENDADDEGLDLSTLILVARRSLPWVLLLLLLAVLGSWLYLRYTKPVYKASSILKIDERKDASELGIGSLTAASPRSEGGSTQLAGEVELIKSGIAYKRLKERMALNVNYYTKGTVLENELFSDSPFKVEYTLRDPNYYKKNFDIEYVNAQTYKLSVSKNGRQEGGTYSFGQSIKLPGITLRLVKNPKHVFIQDGTYHFTLLDDNSIDGYLNRNLVVEVLNPNANTIQISFTDNNPLKAAAIVNELDSVYLLTKVERKKESTARIRDYVNQQIKERGRSLENAEDDLQGFVSKSNTYDARNELAATVTKEEELALKRLELEQSLGLLDDVGLLAEQERLTVREDQTVAQSVPGLADLRDPVLVQLLEELNSQQINLARIKRSYKESTFAVENQEANLAITRQAVRKQMLQARKLLLKKLSLLDEQVNKLEGKRRRLPLLATQEARLQRPLELYNGAVRDLMQKQLDYEIQNAGTIPDFQILSAASSPEVPISPKRLLVYAIGLASGLVMGLGLIAVRYFLHNTVTSVAELERNTKATVLGVIPTYTKEEMLVSKLVVDKNPKASVSEAIRSIRTNLEFISSPNKKRLISITSTISGEGKTFVAVNLAGIIALSGQRVIILDLDMRKPKVNLAFEAGNVKGISTILIDRHTVAESIQRTSIESLDFISAGPTPPNPSELILSPRFDKMLQELHQHYDVIMIDTPPVGLVTDGILIMRRADIPIYVVRANYSRKTFLKNLNRLMRNNQFGRMCTVLNDAHAQGASGYGYGYGYGYGQNSHGMGYYEEPIPYKPTLLQRIKGLFS